MVRDALVVAVLAVLVVQALRRWVGDRYMVPSDSMEPMLHGDERNGDVVFVDKLARAEDCRPGDLVVVQHPEKSGRQLVKRIAARGDDMPGGCWIDLRDGDVWIGDAPDPRRHVRRQKDPLAARALQATWAAAPGKSARLVDLAAAHEQGGFVLPPFSASATEARAAYGEAARRERWHTQHVVPSGCIGTARAVDASFVEATGERGRTGNDVGVHDCSLRLDLAGPCEFLGTVDTPAQSITFHVDLATGRIALWCNGRQVAEHAGPALQGAHRVEFGWLDDRAWFAVDDRRDTLFVVPRAADWPSDPPPEPIGTRTWLHVGAVGAAMQFIAVAVLRDVYYEHEPIARLPGDPGSWPRLVPPGTWFLLGDNPFDSRDSRQFDARPVGDFIGRPRFVVGPWPRTRWLSP